MPKYIFLSDIDGTLLGGHSGIPQNVINAAQEFMNAGGLLSLSTGRSIVSARWVAKEMKVNLPCILYTGAAIYDFETERYIWSCHFNNDILPIIERIYYEYPDFSLQVYTYDNIYMLRANHRLMTRGIKEEIPDSLSVLSDIKGNILKLVLTCDNVERLNQCKEDLFSTNNHVFSFSSTHFVEIVPKGAGKDNAMKVMAEMYKVQLFNFFVAGDGMTDLPMIEIAGYSFAPSSAPKYLLDACKIVIPTYKEGGMEKAFDYARTLMHETP